MGADRAEEYGRRNGVPGELLVRLTPQKMVSAFASGRVAAQLTDPGFPLRR